MTTSAPTVQQSSGSVPITNIQPPPEGQMAASVNVVLTPGDSTFQQTFQLSSQSGLMLSQVTTLCIDNSANAYPLAVTHGALNEVVNVSALATVIVPTFSSRAGGYPLLITAIENNVPTVNLDIDIIFMNYPRPAGTFSAVNQQTIIATGQNTTPLVSQRFQFNSSGLTAVVLPAGNYILDSLDFAFEGYNAVAGLMDITYDIRSGNVPFHSGEVINVASVSQWFPGANINAPGFRTWPQGLLLPRNSNINIITTMGNGNVTAAVFRLNISGVSTP